MNDCEARKLLENNVFMQSVLGSTNSEINIRRQSSMLKRHMVSLFDSSRSVTDDIINDCRPSISNSEVPEFTRQSQACLLTVSNDLDGV